MKLLEIYPERIHYYPGEVVKGWIAFRNEKTVKMRKILLTVRGVETVHIPYGDQPSRKHNKQMSIHRTLKGKVKLSPGIHQYPFRFTIPNDVLPSYSGRFTKVSYVIKAVVDVPNWFDVVGQRTLKVLYHPDSIHQLATQESFTSRSSRLQKLSDILSPGPDEETYATMELDKAVFFAGEAITGNLVIHNPEQDTIRSLKYILRGKEQSRTTVEEEYLTIFGSMALRDKTLRKTKTMEKRKDTLAIDRSDVNITFPFSIPTPRRARTSFYGKYSRFVWTLECRINVALDLDLKVNCPIAIYQWV